MQLLEVTKWSSQLRHNTRLHTLAFFASLTLSGVPVLGEIEHNSGGDEFQDGSFLSESSSDNAIYLNDNPYYVPQDVRDLFEDYYLSKSTEARAKAAGNEDGSKLIPTTDRRLLQETSTMTKRTYRTVTSERKETTSEQRQQMNSTTGSNPQFIPTIFSTVLIKQGSDSTPNAKSESDSENGLVVAKALKRYGSQIGGIPAGKEKLTNNIRVTTTTPSLWDRVRFWLGSSKRERELASMGYDKMPVSDSETFAESHLGIEQPSKGDFTSNQSWFGWVGWIVAFILLFQMLRRARSELK